MLLTNSRNDESADESFSASVLVVEVCTCVHVFRKCSVCVVHPLMTHQSKFGEVRVKQMAVLYNMHIV